MTDDELFRVLSELQHDVRLLRDLMWYVMAMVFVAGAAAVLTPLLSNWRRDQLRIENDYTGVGHE